MNISKVKKGSLIFFGIILVIIVFQITFKILKSGTKVEESVIRVSVIQAELKEINESVVMQGVAEGDPQIKIYPVVSGKFERTKMREGTSVKKNDVILYINRDIVGMKYKLVPIKSPVSGIVTRIYYFDNGMAVSTQYPVAEVADPEHIKVVLNIGEEDMAKLKNGMEASIKTVYGKLAEIKAKVYSLTPFIDKDTMSGTVIVKGMNVDRIIKPGSSVEVTVYAGKRKGIMLPENAVLMGDGKTYVYIVSNNVAKRVDVELGYMAGAEVEIRNGLMEGTNVIVEGNFKLSDGTKVSTQ
ncbi:MAG: efflux RND transporter periplasmic adaptor subunit [bacterium]